MKNLLLIFISALILIACGEKKKEVTVIPDYEAVYLSPGRLDVPAFIGDQIGTTVDETAIKSAEKFSKEINEQTLFYFDVNIYINESGKVDAVQFKERTPPKTDIQKVNPKQYFDQLKDNLVNTMNDWVFNPGLINGAAVKSSLAFTVSILVDKSGEVEQNIKFGEFPPPPPPPNFTKDVYFAAVEEMPEPIGGMQAVQKHITYPELARKAGIQGRVFVRAYIDENGDVSKAEILKGIGAGCDEVSLEAVYKTKFNPGKQRGENVKVQVTIPIVFKLDDKSAEDSSKKSDFSGFQFEGSSPADLSGKVKLSGKIIDRDTNVPIPGANIIVDGTKFGAASNENGEYIINGIPEGEYSLLFSIAGYSKTKSPKYDFGKNNIFTINVKAVRNK